MVLLCAAHWLWAPDVTRRQRVGDLLALSDMLLEKDKGGRR